MLRSGGMLSTGVMCTPQGWDVLHTGGMCSTGQCALHGEGVLHEGVVLHRGKCGFPRACISPEGTQWCGGKELNPAQDLPFL